MSKLYFQILCFTISSRANQQIMAGNKKVSVVEACKGFIIPDEKLCVISDRLLESMKKGLSKATHDSAAVKCFPTYVQDFPTGEEQGNYLALDLGGTNFRVLMVSLERNNKFSIVKEKYEFPDEIKVGTGEKLFGYVAQCVDDFCDKHKIKTNEDEILIPMGFTFSFPIKQIGLNKGILIKWTKGFRATGVIGKDVVGLLRDAFRGRKLHETLAPVAVLNDTTGTLMSCAWEHPNTRIGLIIGTGSNACYAEKIENVEMAAADADHSKPLMIINIEWGNFGADGTLDDILTEYDRDIDIDSTYVREQIFEKCISGRYLGEIMRRVLLKLIKNKTILGGQSSAKMSQPFNFRAEYLTDIERDPPGTFDKAKAALTEMDIKNPTEQDLIDIRYISECISRRSACFVSAGIATLINKMAISPVSVGVDGTVYRQHPTFKSIMEEKIRCLIRPELKFQLMLSEDGSGRGAAFVAAVLHEQEKNKKTT